MWPASVRSHNFLFSIFGSHVFFLLFSLLLLLSSCRLVSSDADPAPVALPEARPSLGAGANPLLLESLTKRLPKQGDKREILISYLAAVPTLMGEIDQYLLNISASSSAQSSSKDRESFSKKLNQIVHCLTTDSYVSVVSGALVAAIVEINRDATLIPDYTLKYVFGNTCGNDSHSTRLFMEHWQAGARVFIGPEKNCKTEAAMAASQNLPIISYRCNDQDISREDYHYRTFARTVPPAGEIFKAFMSLMKQYNWRKFSVVYDVKKGHARNELFETLKRMLEVENRFEEVKFEIQNVSRLEFSKMDISSQQDIQSIENAIRTTMQTTRIYLTFDNVRLFRTMLSIMGDMGLHKQDYMLVYVDTNYDWLNVYHAMNNHFLRNTMTYLHHSWDANNSSDRKMLEYARIALSIIPTPVKLNSQRFYNFWKRAGDYMHYFGVQKTDNLKGNRIACYLYDAVYLYARAIHELVEEFGGTSDGVYDPTADGKAIIDRIVNKKYRSIQGFDMRIDERGNSKGNFSLLSWQRVAPVMNKSDPKYYPLDHALDLTAIFVEAPDKDRLPNLAFRSNRIQWPTGTPPLDEPECGFYGEKCRKKGVFNYLTFVIMGIIGIISVLITAFTINYLRSRRFEKELAQIWKIDQFEIRRVVGGANNESTASLLMQADLLQMAKTKTPWWSRAPTLGSGMRGLASYKGTLVGLKDVMYGRKPKELTREGKKELRAMRQLAHPNVNNFLGVVYGPLSVTVVREYCSKGSLHDILRNENLKLDHMYVASFVDDLVKGMVYIHDSELKMHGNLKSTNCLITSRWTLQIADFGLREIRDGMWFEPSYNVWENFLWTAPEAMTINGSLPATVAPTPKADVYSFGIIFHEIITREGPYKIYVQRSDVNGDSTPSRYSEEGRELVEMTIRRVYNDPYFRPDTSELEVQNYVKDVMAACWHHDPSQRPEFKSGIRNKLKPLFHQIYKQNIMDHMVLMMEKYQTQLEDLVDERTIELRDEQRRSQHLLQRMLPSSVAEQLLAGQDVIPEAFPPVTIYFSDIVGFTTISGESTPMEVVTFLNKLYTLFDSIIRRYDVYKVETIGDAYMVVSGVPQYKTMEYHAEQIAMMAIHILSAVRSFSIPHRSAEQLMIRIGMHTGPCVAGVVGKTMPRYTLFGDTVNTASRMESNGEALRIHCSSSTKKVLASIDDGFLLEERGSMAIKGKGQMTTYWLNGRHGYEFTETIEDKMVVPDIFPRQTTLKNRGSSWGVNRESSLSLATEKSSQLMKRQSAALVRNHDIYYSNQSSTGFNSSRGTSNREMPKLSEDDRESLGHPASLFGHSKTSGRKKSTASRYNGFNGSRIFASTTSNASSTRPSRAATYEHEPLNLRKRSTSLPDGEKLNLDSINTSVPMIPLEPSLRRPSLLDGCSSSQSESPSQSQYPSYRDLTAGPYQRKRGIVTVYPIRKRSLSCGDAVSPKVSPCDSATSCAITAVVTPRPASRTLDCSVRLAGRASSPDEIVFQEDDEHALIGSDTVFVSTNAFSKSEDGLRSCPQHRRKNKHSFLRDPSPLTKRFRDASPFGKKKSFWNTSKSGERTSSPADSISRLFRRFRGGGGNEYADLNDYTVCDEFGEEAFEMAPMVVVETSSVKGKKMQQQHQKQQQREEIGHGARVNRSVSCSPVEGGNSTDNSEPLLTIPSSACLVAASSTSTSTSC